MTNSSSAEKGASTDAEERKVFWLIRDPVKPVVTSGKFGSRDADHTDKLSLGPSGAKWSMSRQQQL